MVDFQEWYDANLPELLDKKNGVYHIAKLAFEAGYSECRRTETVAFAIEGYGHALDNVQECIASLKEALLAHSDDQARQHSEGSNVVTPTVAESET